MRIKYHVSDIKKFAEQDGEELELWLIDHPEYETTDGIIYYEIFKRAV